MYEGNSEGKMEMSSGILTGNPIDYMRCLQLDTNRLEEMLAEDEVAW